MNKYLLTTILSAVILSQTAYAVQNTQTQEFKPVQRAEISNPAPEKPKNEFSRRLNLTEEQKQKAKQLRVNSQEKMKPLLIELKAKQEQLNSYGDTDINDKEVQILNNEIKKIRKDLRIIIIQNERDFMEILTSEQRMEFNKIRNERKQIFRQKQIQKRKF